MDNNIPLGCFPFDIEAVKKGAKVVTRDGMEAKYLGESNPEQINANFPYLFNVSGLELLFTNDGRYFTHKYHHKDLFLVDPNYAEPEYAPTMIISPPQQTTNPQFEFKQEIAAQFVLPLLKSPEYKLYIPSKAIEAGLDNYEIFLQKFKERFNGKA